MSDPQLPSDLVSIRWLPVTDSRPSGGRYVLVSNQSTKKVGFARYRPLMSKWTFPSAAMAFEVTHFSYLPAAAT